MPYVTKEQRKRLENPEESAQTAGESNYLITLWLHKHLTNYASVNQMATIIEIFISRYKRSLPMCNFSDLYGLAADFANNVLNRCCPISDDDVIGALRCAWDEFYRRKVGPYEDEAIERNGDI